MTLKYLALVLSALAVLLVACESPDSLTNARGAQSATGRSLVSGSLVTTFASPVNQSSVGSSFTVTPNYSSDIASVTLWADNWSWVGTSSSAPFTVPVTGLSIGSHTLTIRGTTSGGATTADQTITVQVGTGTTLSGTKTIAITSPTAGASLGSSVTASVSASSDVTAVTFWLDNWTWLGQVTTAPFNYTLTGLSAGSHTLIVRGTTASGNTADQTVAFTVGSGTSGALTTNGSTYYFGKYFLYNNWWNQGAGAPIYCNMNYSNGGANWNVDYNWPQNGSGSIKGYSAIVDGWQWGMWSNNSDLPVPVGTNVYTSANCSYVFDSSVYAQWDMAYDIWFSASTSGASPTAELMIMQASSQYFWRGTQIGSVVIDGMNYSVYYTNGSGWNYIAFYPDTQTMSWTNLNINDFVTYCESLGYIGANQYMTGVQFGTEIVCGKGTLTVNNFSVSK